MIGDSESTDSSSSYKTASDIMEERFLRVGVTRMSTKDIEKSMRTNMMEDNGNEAEDGTSYICLTCHERSKSLLELGQHKQDIHGISNKNKSVLIISPEDFKIADTIIFECQR